MDRTTVDLRARPDRPGTQVRDTITAGCESGFNLVRAAGAPRAHRTTTALRLACPADQLDDGAAASSSPSGKGRAKP
ncbi:hypothetical protein ACWDFR_43110 [Streptomyces sp. 900105755]